jgi:hypothetical protein
MAQPVDAVYAGPETCGATCFDVETAGVRVAPAVVAEASLHGGPVGSDEGRRARPLPSSLDTAKIDHVAVQLKEICRTATLDLCYRIGELVIREIYDNQLDLWGKQGTRRLSYRVLASRGDLPLSPSALCKSVAAYALSERLGGRARWRHLGASHVQEVLSLEASEQDRILRVAESERWTVARIRSEVSAVKPTRRIHQSEARFRRSVGALRACISKHQRTLASLDALEGLDPEVAGQFCDAVAFLKLQVHELEAALGRYKEMKQRSGARPSFIRLTPDASNDP